MKLYNTLTRKKEIFKPRKPPWVGLYTCGPTVYDYDHLGHLWNYTIADILRRILEYNEYKIKHVMNITDVGHLTDDADEGEDKMEKSAQEKGKDVWKIADFFSKIFFKHQKEMNMLEPHIICKATDHIPEMLKLIKILGKGGYAYRISDGIYFNVKKFPNYGKLSGNTLNNLKAGARIKINLEKKDPADFALWKFSPKNVRRQMEWDSPWGKGFPGWHIECSAMSMKYLGKSFDIHTGGEDNIFPHHECEIAQSESATGKKFVNYWIHTRFLTIEGQKMSKSLKNFYRLENLKEKGFNPLSLRYLFLTANYTSKLNFTWEGLRASQNALTHLFQKISELQTDKNQKASSLVKVYKKKFQNFINDNLNTPKALALMWQVIKSPRFSNQEKYQLALDFDRVFGLNLDKLKPLKIPSKIKKLIDEREQSRQKKDWKLADELRIKIKKLGYLVEDEKEGPKLKIIKNH